MTNLSQPKNGSWTDERLEIIIGTLLRVGVGISAAIVLAGGILCLLKYGGESIAYRTFHGEPANLRTVAGIVRGAAAGHSRAIIQFGLLVLIATPIARVVFAAYGFWKEHDHKYVVITLIVLGVLIYSIMHAV